MQSTGAADAWVAAASIDDLAVSHHVVEDDQASATCKLENPGQLVRIVGLVGIDENQVERPELLLGKPSQTFECRPNPDLNTVGHPCPSEVAARHGRMLRIDFKCDQSAAWRQRPREPQRAVAPECPKLQNLSIRSCRLRPFPSCLVDGKITRSNGHRQDCHTLSATYLCVNGA